ncbi:MAG TPA: RNA polymerase sigma factor RpoE [Methylococcaceae bacterium]|jgi:RNA polymerase sigma-70 factor (ECF subfamily)|nr:RNA polymerase sigma factor RpoE [Methylococcaceae bacterium]
MGSQQTNRQLDAVLVSRVQAGDKSAYDPLVIKYQHRVVQLANRFVKDPSEAQDVAQEAFVRAYRALEKFKGDSAFYTWLHRIVINVALNHLVSHSYRASLTKVDIEEAEYSPNVWQLRSMEGPESLLINDEIVQNIQRTINELPEPMRAAIMLREFEGKNYEDIAKALACPVGTVRSRIFRAREAIDAQLQLLLNG